MPLDPAFKPLVGSWTLRSLWRTYSDTGERVEAFGSNPNGRMVLDAGGRKSLARTMSELNGLLTAV